MNYLKPILFTTLTVVLVWALNRPWGSIPAVGPLLSPFTGFWQNAEPTSGTTADADLTIPGTRQPITVVFDDLSIPHVFAKNDHDAYFAQGYLTARDRLWQMEFQTHAAAGRLCELVGDKALELDRYNRRLGMVYGAEQALKGMMSDPRTRESVQSYADGVNAYINQLKPAQYPLEYKLLGYAPEPWKPIKTALFLKYMSGVLALGADDLNMSNVLEKYGPSVTNDLFPDYPAVEDPIIPVGTKWNFRPKPVSAAVAKSPVIGRDPVAMTWPKRDPEIGSNNWAVGPQKSSTGYPMLANDPHLTLSLPSIWYQIQLVSPTMNVYGASMPGAPAVLSGFNKEIAWGVTNVGADVLDFYQIKFKDNTRREYWHNNQWKPVRQRIETIKVKGKPDVVDTVLYTHHGSVMYTAGQKPYADNVPVGYAARWIAHESSNDFLCWYLLNRAKNYDQYLNALTYYSAPAQNFVFADVNKDIAIAPSGRFPLKRKDQGKFLLDGTNPADDWQGWIPADQNPRVKNPARGFVSSANQSSTDPSYPYYINWEFAPSERGRRINQRLTAMQRVTVDSLRMLQNDTYNLRAVDALPLWLPRVETQNLTDVQRQALNALKSWSYYNDTNAIPPTIFTEWVRQAQDAIWQDEFDESGERPMRYPNFDRLLQLVRKDTASHWFDNIKTPARETMGTVLTQSFRTTVDTLAKKHGTFGPNWGWGLHKSTDVMHLARLEPLSVMDVQTGGGSGVVNATTARTGPSWRMVVALGPKPQAYGVYPGGQSGNSGSAAYYNQLETWRKGELNELLFLQSPTETNKRLRARWTLKP